MVFFILTFLQTKNGGYFRVLKISQRVVVMIWGATCVGVRWLLALTSLPPAEVGCPAQPADAAPPADASSADVAADVAHPCTISCPTKCPGELSFALPPKNTSLIDIGNSKPNRRR